MNKGSFTESTSDMNSFKGYNFVEAIVTQMSPQKRKKKGRQQLIELLRNNPMINKIKIRQIQYQTQQTLDYCERLNSLMKWIQQYIKSALNQKSNQSKALEIALSQINSKSPENIIEKYNTIIDHMLTQNNLLSNIIRKGFLYYLFKKYQLYNYSENNYFQEEFQKDIEWFKQYLTESILRAYNSWLYQASREYFINYGIAKILTNCPQWHIIVAIFNKCINKQRYQTKQQQFQQQYASLIIKSQEEQVPFKKTIKLIQEFCDQFRLPQKINIMKKLEETMGQQMKSKRSSQNEWKNEEIKIKYLEYCVFMSKRQTMKSIFYLDILVDLKYTEIYDEIQLLHNSTYVLLSSQQVMPYPCKKITRSKKYIQFKMPIKRISRPFPFHIDSIQKTDYFHSKKNSKTTLFSIQSLQLGSSFTIFFKSINFDLTLGVCNKKLLLQQRSSLQQSPYSIVYNFQSNYLFNKSIKQHIKKQHSSKVTLKITSSDTVQWIIQNNKNIIKSFKEIVSTLDDLYACITIKHGTSFVIVQQF